ncbi:MAG: DUF4350 domain-containing protein [Myxococcales bacterium]|nr:DUF4350 domain-containing protein [Myxococcales bacterium]
MRELALAGFIAALSGLVSLYATDHFGAFAGINLGLGGLALLAAALLGVRRLRALGSPHSRPVVIRGVLRIAVCLVLAVALERAAQWSGVEFDWTREGRFELAPATLEACQDLGNTRATLFYDPEDPRIRRTRLLLDTLAARCPLRVVGQVLDEAVFDEDRYGVGSSNSVVLEHGDRFETIARPTEGTIYEALYRLRSRLSGVLTLLYGNGEGDIEDERDLGFSGFATALETEGYRLRRVASAALVEVPTPTDALVILSPQRHLPDPAVNAIRRWLDAGGRLVAFLEPGVTSGLEDLLGDYGLASPDAVVIDPAYAGRNEIGASIVAANYEAHPVTQGLGKNRMTFFPGARPFHLSKPQGSDKLVRVVLASHRAWVLEDPALLDAPEPPEPGPNVRRNYQTIAAAGRYVREAREIRIVAFGDAEFASNRHLRTLYNLDLALNAVHWATEREPAITLRPKIRSIVQFPLPIESTLSALYGIGLLVPEVLLLAGGIVWLRGRRD